MKIPKKDAYKKSPQSLNFERWWLNDNEETVGQDLIQLVNLLEENQRNERAQHVRHAYLYNNTQGPVYSTGIGLSHQSLPERYYVTYNVVKSAIDTIVAKIAQKELRPRVLTEKGNYAKQQKAKKLTQYLDGTLKAGNVYRIGPDVLRDAGVFGLGIMKVIQDVDAGKICYERVLIDELLVDSIEARYGNPQSLYQMRLVSRDSLMEMFGDSELKRMKIMQAGTAGDITAANRQAVDMIKVYEGWHLGSKNRHTIAINGCTLVNEPWEFDCFPFAFCYYTRRMESFLGQGVAEELLGTQLEINKLLRDIQRAQHLVSVPRVLVERSSEIVSSHVNNEIGSQIKYRGTKPEFITPAAMSNEIYNHVRWLIQSAYEKVGVSVLSATGRKPSGLDSKPALREYADLESERFAITEQHYGEFFEDVARLTIKFSRALYSENAGLKVKAENRKFIETIPWKDVDLDDDSIVTRVYISSLLPTSPGAKLQQVQEFIQAGWMDRETGLQQLNFPDVESWETLETADKELVESMIYDILDKGEYHAPEPESDPLRAVNLGKKAYLEAVRNGAPDKNLELLLRWIDAAASLMPEIAAPVAPEMALPQASAMPLPQSGLLPQVTTPAVG